MIEFKTQSWTQTWKVDKMDHYTDKNAGDILGRETYLEPADVKSPHTSELGAAAGTGEPKSKREAVGREKSNYGNHEKLFA